MKFIVELMFELRSSGVDLATGCRPRDLQRFQTTRPSQCHGLLLNFQHSYSNAVLGYLYPVNNVYSLFKILATGLEQARSTNVDAHGFYMQGNQPRIRAR